MLTREEVQLLSMARVEAVLARIKAWICQHLHFDQNLGLWSQMNHNMEILEREKNHHARLECEARWSKHDLNWPWPNERILDLDHPLTNEHLVLQDLISSRASSLNLRSGCKNQKLCHFLQSCQPYFSLTFPLSISFNNFSLFSKVSVLVTTNDFLVVTTFATVSELFAGDSPQLATSKYENKN